PPPRAAARAARDERDVREIRAAGRERVSRGGRQSASADPVRRERAGRARARRGVRRRDSKALRRRRRRTDRRARRRSREARPDDVSVRRCRPRDPTPREACVRSKPQVQPGKGVSDVAPLRRARTRARARGQGALPGSAAVLMVRAHAENVLRPRDQADLVEILHAHPRPLEPIGGGSKRAIGPPVDADRLELSALSGIVAYEPAELVLTSGAATPLATIEAELARNGQRLAFEPPDFGALIGAAPCGGQTIGGVLSGNVAGPRGGSAGAGRDHFPGFAAVSGAGVPFKAGGRVVKHVTGYDLPKLIAGSWGTLAVLVSVTVRVPPLPETETTVVVPVRDPADAVDVLARGLGSPHDVSAAAFAPNRGAALRIEGFGASVAARVRGLLEWLGRDD